MKNIIVTGATGFIGSNLVEKLSKEYKIGLILRKDSVLPDNLLNLKFDLLCYNGEIDDLIDFFIFFKPECVIHLASFFIAEHDKSNIVNLINSNILFGTQILEAMSQTGVKLLINTGTSWQNFNGEKYSPVCLYAATKESFEKIISYYVEAENFKILTLKLFDTYGENDKRRKILSLLKQIAKDNSELLMSPGHQEINLTHISDVCEAYCQAINLISNQLYFGHKVYFIKNSRSHTLKELVSIVEKISDSEININWGIRPYRKREVMKISNNFNSLPGWEPKISLEEGLKFYFKQK